MNHREEVVMLFPNEHLVYIAIIGDLIDSRKILDRKQVQINLKEALEKINTKYDAHIASKFTITLGDEFQGLLTRGSPILSIVSQIEQALFPQKVRFGVGIGGMTTDINKEQALGSDGPAYYHAREAVNYLKEGEKKKESPAADIRLIMGRKNSPIVELLNTLLFLMTAVKDSWTDRQRETIWAMMDDNDTQTQVAEKLGITQPSVQKNLDKGHYYSYEKAFVTIEKFLAEGIEDYV